jgi:putative ATP-binding cassette transporter
MQPEFNTSYWLFGIFEVSQPIQALVFFFVCLLILFCRGLSGTLMLQVGIDATVRLRKKMYHRISKLQIQKLEQIGPSRLLTAINKDIGDIAVGAATIPSILVAATTFFGMLGFLLYLKLEIFFFVLGIIAFGFLTYQIPIMFGNKYMMRGRNSFDGIQEGIRGLIYGAKELKLNQQKQKAFLSEELYKAEDEFSISTKAGRTFLVFGQTYSNMISFLTIGAVAYVMANYFTLDRDDLLGSVMILLYIMGPITVLVGSMSALVMAKVAARKLNLLFGEMAIEADSKEDSDYIDFYQTLKLENTEYAYPALKNEDGGFHLGPINLTFNRGEITYLVGGNGSGKTSLAKLLSLHYIPEKGSIYFDDIAVTGENRDACRQSISAIYSDFYLFTKLFGLSDEELDIRATEKLKQLGLEEKVTIKDGQFSSTALSDGQKKRLALLVTYLEDRSIYVFDEWAADQDPEFKEIFYNDILPNLKKRNKMIIVITHDDRYFHLADRLVRMEAGRVIEERTQDGLKKIDIENEDIGIQNVI